MPSSNDFGLWAFKLLGVAAADESALSAEDGETAFEVLNHWIDSLGTERDTMYFLTRTTQTLTSGTSSYTIGTGGTIAIVRPVFIEKAMLIIDTTASTLTETPIRVLMDGEYAGWAQKTLQNSLTAAIWYDHQWSSGLGTIYPLPIPNVSTTRLVLYTPTAVTEFADQSTNYTFPPGYRRAIIYNLAYELLGHYPGAKPPDNLEKRALTSLAGVKRANLRLDHVVIDPTITGRRALMTEERFSGGTF